MKIQYEVNNLQSKRGLSPEPEHAEHDLDCQPLELCDTDFCYL